MLMDGLCKGSFAAATTMRRLSGNNMADLPRALLIREEWHGAEDKRQTRTAGRL
jgi:hypothetical protein